MTIYSKSFKEVLVKKALLQPDISPRQFAKEAGISNSSLYGWILKYKKTNNGTNISNSNNHYNNWTIEERFNILLETTSLTEEQQGAYCRRKGIFKHQLSEWKKEFMEPKTETKKAKAQVELKSLRLENKALKKDLRRKDKALAETSALLILKKKANLLWGEIEED